MSNTTATTVTTAIAHNIYRYVSSPKISAPKVKTAFKNVNAVLPTELPRTTVDAMFLDYMTVIDAYTPAMREAAVAKFIARINAQFGESMTVEQFEAATN